MTTPPCCTCTTCQPQVQQAGALYRGLLLDNFPEIDSFAFAQWLQSQRTYFADRLAAVQRPLVPTPKPRGKLTPLIGRTEEIAALTRQLRHTVYRCISLVGLGGIGKSRLACAVGEQLQADFPDDVWLVELSGLAPATDAESAEALHDRLATAIARTMVCPLRSAAHPTAQVAAYLADKTALLILDSFEHLTPAAAWLPPLLADAPHLRLLVTTRHRLPQPLLLIGRVVNWSLSLITA